MPSAITLHDLSFEWPDGTVVLSGLNATFGTGRTGLVGDNGTGKSTLLRLVAGRLSPTAGAVVTTGSVGHLPQTVTLTREATLADLLGITPKVAALHAIEAGDVDEQHFETLGDDWDIESRAAAALAEVGLADAALDRRVEQLSGGEAVLVATLGLRLLRHPVTLLDEPTNNLDRDARARLRAIVRAWPGTLVVVSHDTALLDVLDTTAELHTGSLTTFGGPYDAWRRHLDQQQAAAAQAVRAAEQTLEVERRRRQEAEVKLARRARTAQTNRANKKAAKIVMNGRASDAQNAAGKLRTGLDDRLQDAQATHAAAAAHVRTDQHVSLVLPDPDVPRGRRIAALQGGDRTFVVQGPERVVLVGPNGVGKSTLLRQLVERRNPEPGRASGRLETDRVGYLPQRLDDLDDDLTAVENIRLAAPALDAGTVRNQLGRLLLRGDSVHRPVSTLSGGERFRVSLARLLLRQPPAQLLVLDEPTNNLDVGTVTHLVEALAAFRGALLVVSHDDAFVRRLDPTTVLALDADGGLTPVDPAADAEPGTG
ncbi:ATPase components of ABC transporters with duplicated ATPase domains [Friedmanniella luteola]|uniref:ATPase components of ABC transporters with duplicated ATPase domains n=1 Tax=Friedmanniella luteola TaxID=546871 RepID=A0A1H1VEC3_9ACTN|nr:ATP-binding cassette domain-containing protein [Friedmanniella luteola]SDS83137.1 ATPase components of ABC transporters with duplicated ATPase domains [Friedmanniella luteola]